MAHETKSIAGQTPLRWLHEVLSLFPDSGWSPDCFEVVPAAQVPEPCARLLVHRHHMTVTLENFHGCPVVLETLDVLQRGDEYTRRLLLRAGPGGPIVMVGVVRFWLHYVSEPIRREILARDRPLGRILIEHGVLRRIETAAFLRCRLVGELGTLLAAPPGDRSSADATRVRAYGRIATIYCDNEPAVELLEIVPPRGDGEPSGAGSREQLET